MRIRLKGKITGTDLEDAERQGEVRIRRRNGHVFVIRPEKQCKRSPLDIKRIDTGIDANIIVEIVQEGRKRDTWE